MNPPTVIFWKIYKIVFLFCPPTLNIICFVEKNNIFLSFCLCISKSATVKSDCPMQENYERFNTDCWFTLLVIFRASLNLKKIP